MSYLGGQRKYIRNNLPTPYGIAVFGDFIYWVDRNQRRVMKAHKRLNASPSKWLKASLHSLADVAIFDKNRQPNSKSLSWCVCKVERGLRSGIDTIKNHT